MGQGARRVAVPSRRLRRRRSTVGPTRRSRSPPPGWPAGRSKGTPTDPRTVRALSGRGTPSCRACDTCLATGGRSGSRTILSASCPATGTAGRSSRDRSRHDSPSLDAASLRRPCAHRWPGPNRRRTPTRARHHPSGNVRARREELRPGTRRDRRERRAPTTHHRSRTPTADIGRSAATGTAQLRCRRRGAVRSPSRTLARIRGQAASSSSSRRPPSVTNLICPHRRSASAPRRRHPARRTATGTRRPSHHREARRVGSEPSGNRRRLTDGIHHSTQQLLLRRRYDGVDPLTGSERHRWHPAGHSREDAEAIAKTITDKRAVDTATDKRPINLGQFMTETWMPHPQAAAAPRHLEAVRVDGRQLHRPTAGDSAPACASC